jgi:muconolactone delta-isomerase
MRPLASGKALPAGSLLPAHLVVDSSRYIASNNSLNSRRLNMSKTILITGASSGFGRDTAETLHRAGHTVYASMRGAQGKNREPAEAVRSRELAVQGPVLRLWRPPLQPGEWRTLGMFAAGDDGQLEKVLASMPLRVWRTDEVTPLSPHRNDPGWDLQEIGAEFPPPFTAAIPAGTPGQAVADIEAREA